MELLSEIWEQDDGRVDGGAEGRLLNGLIRLFRQPKSADRRPPVCRRQCVSTSWSAAFESFSPTSHLAGAKTSPDSGVRGGGGGGVGTG